MADNQLANEFLEVIPPLVWIIRSEIRSSAAPILTMPQFRVLANIHNGMNTVSEIAAHQGVSQPAMTKMVNGLEKRGLVRREVNKKDTRQVFLSLTAKGKRLHRQTWKATQLRMAKRLKA